MTEKWQGKRVVILGAARQGQALARYLVRHGAQVTLNDRRSEAELASARSALSDLELTWVTGEHPLHILDGADLLCLSGGIPLNLPIVAEAQNRGLPVSNDTQLFMEAVPCPTVGITGSAGKTTTTTLVGLMAKAVASPQRNVYVGGNIGDPLINYLDEMKPNDLAILEISSFQLEQMTISPNVAAVLNITPNHLDRHGTMEAYTAAKSRILEFQSAKDIAVLCREDPGAWGLLPKVVGSLVTFGFERPADGQTGTFLKDDVLTLRQQDTDTALLPADEIKLRGAHNVMNVLAACAIIHAAGLDLKAALSAIKDFGGVAHRLELVREDGGIKWYNDSIATAPERTMAAIHSFDEPLVLLLGGRDKDLPWQDLARLVHQRVDHVVLFGEAADKIAAALGRPEPGQRPFSVDQVRGLEEAVQAAAQVAEAGDVVLLSPGGTSYDQFRDFEERGEEFRKWVHNLS
jgi:UDP-N-acetylmuramoylalanine--D-glutamate ligase